nr:uncharacterized protein LOC113398269 [Vanessa tameamea]
MKNGKALGPDNILVEVWKVLKSDGWDVLDCNYCRGKKFISHTMKVWEQVIEGRLREESEITQNQFGFMAGRGTMDAIFALRQLGSCTYTRSSAGNTNQFSVAVDLHQGLALSPYLFLVSMDSLTADIQEEARWCMLFADNIVLVGEDEHKIQSRLEDWHHMKNDGLKINRTRTEYMFCGFAGLSGPEALKLDGAAHSSLLLLPVARFTD